MLAATSVKFAFPPPGSLMGIRNNTRAILKLANCSFTYPGRSTPSLFDVTYALSLSSRVGIVGPNGAGKSTLVKLLTIGFRSIESFSCPDNSQGRDNLSGRHSL